MLEGTESLRVGVLASPGYPANRKFADMGDPRVEVKLGLPGVAGNVADVGVLRSPGEFIE